MKLHAQIDDRGDLPDTAGLARSLRWPGAVFTNTTEMVYGPDPDGREAELDPIVKPTLGEMARPEALARLAANVPAMLDLWVPDRGYAGLIEIDLEYSWYAGPYHTESREDALLAAGFPTYTRGELWGAVMRLVVSEVLRARPKCGGVLWFGLACPNPGAADSPAIAADVLRMAKRDGVGWRKAKPATTFYITGDEVPVTDRVPGWRLVQRAVIAAVSDPGYAEINVRVPGPDGMPTGRFLTEAEVWGLGMYLKGSPDWDGLITWHALAGVQDRDDTQAWIDGPFTAGLRRAGLLT